MNSYNKGKKKKKKKNKKSVKDKMVKAGFNYLNERKAKPTKIGGDYSGHRNRLQKAKKKRDSLRTVYRNMK